MLSNRSKRRLPIFVFRVLVCTGMLPLGGSFFAKQRSAAFLLSRKYHSRRRLLSGIYDSRSVRAIILEGTATSTTARPDVREKQHQKEQSRRNKKEDDEPQQQNPPLTRTVVHRMRKPELTEQLELRNMNATGLKKDLVHRLLEALEAQDLDLITSDAASPAPSASTPALAKTKRKPTEKTKKANATLLFDEADASSLSELDQSNATESTVTAASSLPENTTMNLTPVDSTRTVAEQPAPEKTKRKSTKANATLLSEEADQSNATESTVTSASSQPENTTINLTPVESTRTAAEQPAPAKTINKANATLFEEADSLLSELNQWNATEPTVKTVSSLPQNTTINLTQVDSTAEEQPAPAKTKRKSTKKANATLFEEADSLLSELEQSNATEPTVKTVSSLPQNTTIDLTQVDPTRTYVLRIKGLSSMHSNSSGVGIVLVDADDDRDVCTARKVLQGDRSVFEAEYSALVIGVKFAVGRGVRKLVLQMDHDVIANQLLGNYPVNRENLQPMYWNIMLIKEEVLEEFTVELISVKDNVEAHELAQRGLATRRSYNISDTVPDPMESSPSLSSTSTLAPPAPAPSKGSLLPPRDPPPTDPGAPMAPMNYQVPVTIDPDKLYDMHFDGGARGNPGSAGAGMVLYDGDNEIWCGWKYLGKAMSNNAAEYNGLLVGLQCALSLGVKRIRVQGDSDLIVKQINGVYRVKDAKLKILHGKVKKILPGFDYFELKHFRRAFNKRADWLANHAMDTESAYGYEELQEE